MRSRKLSAFLSCILLLSVVLSACAAPAPQTIIQTVVVTELVEGTPVEKVIEKVVTPTPVPPTEVPPTAEPQLSDTVIIGLQQEPDTLHSQLSTMSASTMVINLVEPGCMLQNEKLEWVPLGCEEIPSIANGGAKIVGEGDDQHLEITYKIRKGWRWTDGEPVKATDAVYWWKLNMDPEFESQGRTTIEKIYDVTAVDDSTALVKYMSRKQLQDASTGALQGNVDFAAFKEDYAATYGPNWEYFAVDPTFWYNALDWMPEHLLKDIPAGEQDASEFARKPVGDGAYEIVEWKAGQEIVLEASDQPFPLGEPKVKNVIFRFYGDGAGIKAALQSGEIDAAFATVSGLSEADGPDLDVIEATGMYKVDWVPQFNFEHIDLNMDKFPMDDVKVRQALYLAIDRQAINDALYYGKRAIIDLPLPKGLSWAYPADSDLTIYEYNPEKAAALLTEAGWDCSAMPCTKQVDGQTKSLEFTFMTTDRQDRQKVAQMLQAMWKKINVGVNLQFLYGRGLFSNCSAGGPLTCRTFDAAMYGFTSGDDAIFNTIYSCAGIPSEANAWSGQNYAGWCNEKAQEALGQSENNPDVSLAKDTRMPYLKTFFKEMTSDVPVIFLFGSAWPYPHRTGWKNFKAGSTQYSYPTWNPWEWEIYK